VRDQEAVGELQVAVVLHYAGIEDVRAADSVEGWEVVVLEGFAELDGAVAKMAAVALSNWGPSPSTWARQRGWMSSRCSG